MATLTASTILAEELSRAAEAEAVASAAPSVAVAVVEMVAAAEAAKFATAIPVHQVNGMEIFLSRTTRLLERNSL